MTNTKKPPEAVVAAVVIGALPSIFYIIWSIELLRRGLQVSSSTIIAVPLFAALLLIIATLTCAVGYFLYRGRKVALWIVIIYAIYSAQFSLRAIFSSLDPLSVMIKGSHLATAAYIFVAILLLVPSSRKWFSPNNLFNQKPIRGSH